MTPAEAAVRYAELGYPVEQLYSSCDGVLDPDYPRPGLGKERSRCEPATFGSEGQENTEFARTACLHAVSAWLIGYHPEGSGTATPTGFEVVPGRPRCAEGQVRVGCPRGWCPGRGALGALLPALGCGPQREQRLRQVDR
jgi:hypothetical protein